MTDTLLRHLASSRLPLSFHRREDIEQIQALCAQGLLIALMPAPAGPLAMTGPAQAAQVLALTQKGRAAASGSQQFPVAVGALGDEATLPAPRGQLGRGRVSQPLSGAR